MKISGLITVRSATCRGPPAGIKTKLRKLEEPEKLAHPIRKVTYTRQIKTKFSSSVGSSININQQMMK